MYKIGDKVRLGGIDGQIVGYRFDEGNVWIVNLAGVTCECSDEELNNGYPPAEWESACGKSY